MKIPISWKKSVIAKELQWIGWRFNFSAGLVSLDPNKRKKLINLIDAISGKTYIHKRDIERFLGLAMWVTQLFSGMRPLLQHFYADLFSSPASLYSIDPGMWPGLWNHLDDSLHFVSIPPGTGIPKNGILVSVRHQSVYDKADLERIRLSERRLWLRVRNPNSSKRSLSKSSVRCLQFFPCTLSRFGQVSQLPMHVQRVPHFKLAASSNWTNLDFGFQKDLVLQESRLWDCQRDWKLKKTSPVTRLWPRWLCCNILTDDFE